MQHITRRIVRIVRQTISQLPQFYVSLVRASSTSTSTSNSTTPSPTFIESDENYVQQVLLYGDSRLREVCPLVYEKARDRKDASVEQNVIAKQLCATAASYNSFGLAAPQIGKMRRMFAVTKDWRSTKATELTTADDYAIYVDPIIVKLCQSCTIQEDIESCLSIPGHRGPVSRFSSLYMSYIDGSSSRAKQKGEGGSNKKQRNNKRVTKKFVGFHARIIQHEMDHLNGVLYIDHVDPDDIVKDGPLA
jgi:peptide deformylase